MNDDFEAIRVAAAKLQELGNVARRAGQQVAAHLPAIALAYRDAQIEAGKRRAIAELFVENRPEVSR